MSKAITLNGIEYVPASEVTLTPTEKQIVVLQRAWVVVGDVCRDGDQVTVRNASVIRTWGTTKGLGELALSGPTSKTVLDKAGTVRAHALGIVLTLDTDAGLWA